MRINQDPSLEIGRGTQQHPKPSVFGKFLDKLSKLSTSLGVNHASDAVTDYSISESLRSKLRGPAQAKSAQAQPTQAKQP